MKASELEIGKKYYTNSYTGIIMVTLLEIIDEETALVKTKKSEPFKKSIKWLWETEDIAKNAGRAWESARRRRLGSNWHLTNNYSEVSITSQTKIR